MDEVFAEDMGHGACDWWEMNRKAFTFWLVTFRDGSFLDLHPLPWSWILFIQKTPGVLGRSHPTA